MGVPEERGRSQVLRTTRFSAGQAHRRRGEPGTRAGRPLRVASASRKPTLIAFARWHGIILENVQAIPRLVAFTRRRPPGQRRSDDPRQAGGRARAGRDVERVTELAAEAWFIFDRLDRPAEPGTASLERTVRAEALLGGS